MNRYIAFGISIFLGLAAALYYGWVGRSVEITDADPARLRVDFRADYALMVAESFAADHNTERAINHLAFLDAKNPLSPVLGAIDFGQKETYSEQDVAMLVALAEALGHYDPTFTATSTP